MNTPPAAPTDTELMSSVRAGDQDALLMLYQRYGNMVYSLAVQVVRDAGLAEEVTQDTFLKVWKQATRWDPAKGKFSSWLLTIARRTAIDRYRQLGRQVPLDPTPIEENPSSFGRAARVDGQDWINGQVLRELMAQLPPEQAQLIELAFYQGMSHSELADRLNLPLGTVKTRLRLGMQKLRALWIEAVDGPSSTTPQEG